MSDWHEPGLVVDVEMAMHWWTDMPDVTVPAVATDNARILRALSSLRDAPSDAEDEHSRRELAQINARLDLLLDLVAELHFRQRPPSLPRPLRLSSQGIVWWEESAEAAPGEGEEIVVEFIPESAIPKAITLPARVVAQHGDSAVEVHARWRELSAAEADELARWVFRRHRQDRAQERAKGD
ncbi:MAG: PilZ domain-containing protein [Chromatiales bacterium]|nr:PilZ domain-containing protein [Chromatiales bacterium]